MYKVYNYFGHLVATYSNYENGLNRLRKIARKAHRLYGHTGEARMECFE